MRSHRCQQRHHTECTIPPREGAPVQCDCSCHNGQPVLPSKMVTGESKGKDKCPGHHVARPVWLTPFPVFAGSSKVTPPKGCIFLDLAGLGQPLVTVHGLDLEVTPCLNPRIIIRWPDMSAPDLTREHWDKIVSKLAVMGLPVYVACMGGHGRTGTALAILGCLLGVIPEDQDPVSWLRTHYCDDLVETHSQIEYISQITGREVKSKPHGFATSVWQVDPWVPGTPLDQCRYYPEHKGCDTLGHAPLNYSKKVNDTVYVGKPGYTTSSAVNLSTVPSHCLVKGCDRANAIEGTAVLPFCQKHRPIPLADTRRCLVCHGYDGHFKSCATLGGV